MASSWNANAHVGVAVATDVATSTADHTPNGHSERGLDDARNAAHERRQHEHGRDATQREDDDQHLASTAADVRGGHNRPANVVRASATLIPRRRCS
jgi:hypothetical protein